MQSGGLERQRGGDGVRPKCALKTPVTPHVPITLILPSASHHFKVQ